MGPVNQTVLISEQLLDAKSLLLTANTTTAYTILYRDTKDDPLVLEIPSEALVPMDEGWFRCVTDVGITGPDKGKGGKYLLLPPGYTGAIPDETGRRQCHGEPEGVFAQPSRQPTPNETSSTSPARRSTPSAQAIIPYSSSSIASCRVNQPTR
jgi:hypothetical protein